MRSGQTRCEGKKSGSRRHRCDDLWAPGTRSSAAKQRSTCLLNRWQRASSARCLQKEARGLTTPRSSKPPFPDSVDVIVAEIEVSQRCALRQHSCKPLCPGCLHVIPAEIEVSQRCAFSTFSNAPREMLLLCLSVFYEPHRESRTRSVLDAGEVDC
jgi:hypothetical protein